MLSHIGYTPQKCEVWHSQCCSKKKRASDTVTKTNELNSLRNKNKKAILLISLMYKQCFLQSIECRYLRAKFF